MLSWFRRKPEPEPVEFRLPSALLERASLRDKEYAWRLADVPAVLAAAQVCELATVGTVVQFRIPTGTCELYWRCADAEPKHTNESRHDYVVRSATEVLAAINSVSVTEMIAEGVEWSDVAVLQNAGLSAADYLYFVIYFSDQ